MTDKSEAEVINHRRRFFEASLAALIVPLGRISAEAAGAVQNGGGEKSAAAKPPAEIVFEHDLPNVSMDGWQVTVAEVTTQPGPGSHRHQHPGFVLGYVLEGDLRFQVDGQPERTIPAGQMFYEAPGGVHAVSASASPTKPVRFLAMILAPKGVPLTTPAA